MIAALAAGCVATRADVDACETHAECRAQFGFASVCTDDGYCDDAPSNKRCGTTFPRDLFANREDYADAVVFGNLMDESLATHRARELSAQLAIKQANEAGGLELRKFGVVFCTIQEDDELDFDDRPTAAVHSAEYLIDTLGVPAIIGPAASDDVQLVFQSLRDRGVVFISPSATSPALTTLDPAEVDDADPGLLWRTAPPDSLQGAAIAYDMRAPGAGRAAPVDNVAVIHHTGAYGEALALVFSEEFIRLGGTPTSFAFTTESEMSDAIGNAAIGEFDEVLFVSSQTLDAIAFLDAAADLSGFDGVGLFLTDAAANPDLLMQATPTRFGQVRGTRQAPRDETTDLVYASFIAAYSAEYGEDVKKFSFTANAFDAAWMLVYGAGWALLQDGEITGRNIARGLRRLSDGPVIETRPTTWNQVLQAFGRGESVDISGASGDLDYDPVTEETTGEIETWRIEDGAIVGIETWPPKP